MTSSLEGEGRGGRPKLDMMTPKRGLGSELWYLGENDNEMIINTSVNL